MLDCIALDMDGILYDWEGRLSQLISKEFNLTVRGRTRTWGMEWMTPGMWRWYNEHAAEAFEGGNPLAGAAPGARQLMNLTWHLHIVTSGPEEAEEPKRRWLASMGIKYDAFTLLPLGVLKSSVPADLYIDDNPAVVDDVLGETRAQVILLDHPYNSGPEAPALHPNPRLYRAYSWNGIVRIAALCGTIKEEA